jgi:hypothetical protein
MTVRKPFELARARHGRCAGECGPRDGDDRGEDAVLFDGALPLSATALAEWNRAYSEKVAAGFEGAVAAAAEWQGC